MAGLKVEGLFTAALGLVDPWKVDKVDLNTLKRRIDFEVVHTGTRMACPTCAALEQPVHERVRRSWRHLDFFQFEAWLHASIPRVGCTVKSRLVINSLLEQFRLFGVPVFQGLNGGDVLQQ